MGTVAEKFRSSLRDFKRMLRVVKRIATARNRALPDFIIVGAQRAGTSSLYGHLGGHPQVIRSTKKELHYFDDNFGKGLAWYKSHFPTREEVKEAGRAIGDRVITGEASPYYLFHPHAPKRIAAALPNVKIIVLLRDPVARAYSHYHHERRQGRESLSFEEAINQEPRRLQGELEKLLANESYRSEEHRRHSYLARGLYRGQLEEYFKHFPRERILILSSEEFFTDTQAAYDRALSFLGLENQTLAKHKIKNEGGYDKKAIPLEERLRAYFKPHNQELNELLQKDFGW